MPLADNFPLKAEAVPVRTGLQRRRS